MRAQLTPWTGLGLLPEPLSPLPPDPTTQHSCWQDNLDLEGELTVDEPDIHCVPDDTRTLHHPRSAGRTYGEAHGIYQKHRRPDWNPWHPYKNARDFELGRLMMEFDLTKTAIDDFLQRGLEDDRCTSFNSADELWALLENLEFGFGSQSWNSFEMESGTLWTRNVLQCIQLLLGVKVIIKAKVG